MFYFVLKVYESIFWEGVPLKSQSVFGVKRLLHRISKNAFQGPPHRRSWCGTMVRCVEGCPWVPSLFVPSWEIKARNRISVQQSLPILKLNSVLHPAHLFSLWSQLNLLLCWGFQAPTWSLPMESMWLSAMRLLRSPGYGDRMCECMGHYWVGWGGERALLFPPGIVLPGGLGLGGTGCFFKMTNQLPRFLQAFWWVYPLVRLIGLYGPEPSPVPPSNPVPEGGREAC